MDRLFRILLLPALWIAAASGGRAADAPTYDVVFGIDGTLIQGVRKENLKSLEGRNIIKIHNNYYVLADDAEKALKKISKLPHVRVSFMSEFSSADTAAVLDTIDLKSTAFKVLGREDLPVGKDLLKLGTDPRNTVLVDSHWDALPEDQQASLYRFGPPLFEYDSIKQARAAEEELQEKAPDKFDDLEEFFPKSQDEIDLHRNRMALIYSTLSSAVESAGKDDTHGGFAIAVQRAAAVSAKNPTVAIQDGETHLSSYVEWGKPDGKRPSCIEKSKANPDYRKTVPIENCIAAFPETIRYAWIDKSRGNCGVFTADFMFLMKADPKNCEGGSLICSPETGVISRAVQDLAGNWFYTVIPSVEEAQAGDTLTRYGALAHTLLDDKINQHLMEDLGENCGEFVRKIYQSGHILYSKILHDAAIPLKDFNQYADGKPRPQPVFYHFSDAQQWIDSLHPEIADRDLAQKKIASEHAYDKEFYYYSTRSLPNSRGAHPEMHLGTWYRVIYVGFTPESCSSFGTLGNSFVMSPDARIIDWNEGRFRLALDEMESRYPGFEKACGGDLPIRVPDTYRQPLFNNILPLIIQDSDIDMASHQTGQWFQIYQPRNIIGSDVLH